MRKSDKKIDNKLRIALTDVCELALKNIEGFQWLTHIVNYANFPQSLKVVCVFDTNEHLDSYWQSTKNQLLVSLVAQEFTRIGINVKSASKHISYDTEENCTYQHEGNWARRLG
ncbi:Fis family transcriptional regulator [Thalassotalea sp. M1531]|uniref:Fis family transcriptional regulator n=2 Tax=Thalassotalea algicola TaxID=2716224 RepID=A0A7Y0LBJ8_9GAMM|nr:Fis family transcriptional regulator [Thalassotalea algicola]